MTVISRALSGVVSCGLVCTAMLASSGTVAHDFKAGSIEIGHPWSRPTPPGIDIAGGYLTITNKGRAPDRLVGGTSSAANRIEVHEMANVGGETRTRPVAGGLEIRPGKTIELKPGSHRILMFGLKEPLKLGQKVQGTLLFEKAGSVAIEYYVEENPEALKGAAPGMGGHRGH
jgi:copper(I)-binding protein